jgi:hypothetical protein
MICETRLAYVNSQYFVFKKNELDIQEARSKIKTRTEVFEKELAKAQEDFQKLNQDAQPSNSEHSSEQHNSLFNEDSQTESETSDKSSGTVNSMEPYGSEANSLHQ